MSYADCLVAALAKTSNAELLTSDREFKAVENDLKKIRWLGKVISASTPQRFIL